MKKGNEKVVGATISRPHFEGKTQTGITLIALIITIIVMLILVGVTVNIALNGGLFDAAKQAATGMNKAQIEERAYMIKAILMADMESKDDIIVATQEFKNRLVSEFGVTDNEMVGNKVIVADGKYDIIVKNSDLDIEVKEHNDYVNINSIITPNITWETTKEGDITIGAKVKLDLVLNLTSEEYKTLKKQEAMNVAYEEKTEVVLEYLSTNTKTEIKSIDDYFLLAVNSMLAEYGLNSHDTLEECLEDENVRAKAGVAEGEEFTKGQIYNYFLNGDISQKLTEKQVIEAFYKSIAEAQLNTNEYTKEYEYATKNLTIGLKKGNKIQIKDVNNLVDGKEECSFEISENGTYEILIGNRTTGEDILIQEEKMVVNNIVSAEDAISREEATGIWTTDGNGTITKYYGKENNVRIPKYIGTEKVISIGDNAFANCTDLAEVTIPDSITSVKSRAFANCTSLTDITIPNSVTSIGSSAFANCTSLTEITIPNSVTSINSAFTSCTGLTEITIPNSVTSIDGAFNGCTSLKSITIPNSVTSIDGAFNGCTSLTEITIPNSVTSIGSSAFANCTSLTEITIPDSVTSIGSSTFHSCIKLTSITIPNSVTSIGSRAFQNCTSLTEITIPNSVTSISDAFFGCTGLKSITIPNSVTSINSFAFNGCTGLENITIPNSVTSIATNAFNGCTGLESITIPNSVTSLKEFTFRGCTSLKNITIPNSVTSIERNTFYECTGLENITIPNSVTSIATGAFNGCTSLKNIYLVKGNNSKPSGEPWGATGATVTEIDPPAAE